MAADRFRVALWLKTHGAAERSFARALRVYFNDQGNRIADALRANFHGALPSPDQTPLIFRVDEEHARLTPILHRNLRGLMIVGAKAEGRAAERRLDAKAAEDEFSDVDLPEVTLDGIRRALRELEAQPYWEALQSETEANLTAIIQQGIEEKLGSYQLGIRIREHFGGMPANKRAQKIARTETTSAMNAGHMAFMKELEDDGIIVGRQWEAIGDGDMRPEHGAINGLIVPSAQPFIVGGYPAPYPGHWSLPAAQRINCRCTVLSVFADALVT